MSCFHKAIVLILLSSHGAHASLTLLDSNDWKFQFGGFVALEAFKDSTQGVGEVIGNGPVTRPGDSGDQSSLQFSAKHSRISFAIFAPAENGWKPKGYFEADFLGRNSPSTEQSFYSNGTFRVRHVYFSVEKNGWKLLAGQTSALFGFVPTYLLATVSVIPGPAQIYQRTAQLQAVKTLNVTDKTDIDVGVAIARPTQSQSGYPNLDAGIKWKNNSRKGRMTLVTGEPKIEPTSVALSGTFRQFTWQKLGTQEFANSNGLAMSANFLLPILPARETSATDSLILTASFTTGNGYSDLLSGWSGNVTRFPQNATDTTQLDAGLGGYDAAGNFSLVSVQTWNTQLQYHFPSRSLTSLTAGYAQLWSADMSDLGPAASGKVIYNGVNFYFANIARDLTKQMRVAFEYSRKNVHYIDDVLASNHRFQFSALYRF